MIRKFLLFVFVPFLLFFSFPPINLGFLYIPTFAFLLYLIKKDNQKELYREACITFSVYYFLVLHWLILINIGLPTHIRILIFFGTIALSSIIGALIALPFLIINPKNNSIYLLPIFWSSMEFLSSIEKNTAFLWLTPAHSMINYSHIIQIADIGGSYIITTFVIFSSIFIYKIIVENKKQKIINSILFLIMFLFVFIYGQIRLNQNFGNNNVRIAIIQPNMPAFIKQGGRHFRGYRGKIIENYLKKIHNVDLIVLPETASPVYLQRHSKFRDFLQEYAKQNKTNILIGSLRMKYIRNKKHFLYYNSAFLINDTISFYDKIRPLGFAERLPFDDKLTFLRKIPLGQGDFSPGNNYKVFTINDTIKFSTYICFESIFPTMASEFARNGAEFLINISEDIWFKGTIGPYQHFAVGRLRSVENRRYLLRASNPGISAIIDPKGNIIKQIDLYNSGIIRGKITLNNKLTFYTKYNNIIPKIFILFLLIFYLTKYMRRHYYERNKS